MSTENIKIGHTRAFNVNQNIMSIFFDELLFSWNRIVNNNRASTRNK